jgi:chromosome segregation ATPase
MTPDPGVERQVDNQGHDIARHGDAIAALPTNARNEINGLRQDMNTQRLSMNAIGSTQKDIRKETARLRQDLTDLQERIKQSDNIDHKVAMQEIINAIVLKDVFGLQHDLKNVHSRLAECTKSEKGPLLQDRLVSLLKGIGGLGAGERHQLAGMLRLCNIKRGY